MNNLLFEERERIALITMNRPAALNALNSETLEELGEAFLRVKDDPRIKGAILTGNGKAFVAGADISQLAAFDSGQGREYIAFGQEVINRIELTCKPFLAAVNGFALGGGCELALACDLRLASDKAVFGLPEVNLGLIPGFGGTQRLARLVGPALARELIYTGRNVKAEEAAAKGLVNRVVPDDTLMDEAWALMRVIVSKSGTAMHYAKSALVRGRDVDLYQALELEKNLIALCFSTPDQKEGCRAFLEKRHPEFTS